MFRELLVLPWVLSLSMGAPNRGRVLPVRTQPPLPLHDLDLLPVRGPPGNSSELDFADPLSQYYCMPTPRSTCWPESTSLEEFQLQLSDDATVVFPYEKGFAALTMMRNAQLSSFPGMVVEVATAADIQVTVKFAKQWGLRTSVLSTAHDYDGRSSADGSVNINLSKMKWTRLVADSKMSVGPGCAWNDVYLEAAKTNQVPVSGYDHSVGISGLTMGGGHGAMSRLHGLAADQLLGATVVTAEGEILHANSTSYPDLFWALRGGGGFSFGIVVDFIIQLHPAPPFVTEIIYVYPLRIYYEAGGVVDGGKDILNQYFHNATFWKTLPRGWAGWHSIDTTSRYSVSEKEGYLGQLAGSLVYTGGNETESSEISREFEFNKPAWSNSFNTQVYKLTYASMLDYIENGTTAAGSYYRQFIGNIFVEEKHLADSRLTDNIVDNLVALAYSGATMNYFANNVLGGAISDVDEGETAVSAGFRNALFEVGPNEGWIDPAFDLYYNSLSSQLSEQLYNISESSYVNEWSTIPGQFNDMEDWKYRFWGDNYDRLLAIKQLYDPCNYFVVFKGVGSDEDVNSCY